MRAERFEAKYPTLARAAFIVVTSLGPFVVNVQAQDSDASQPETVELASAESTLESHFADYLHFAVIGRFDVADSHAQALLKAPELNPLSDKGADELVALSDKYERSMDILPLIISNSDVGDNAKKISDLIREAHLREKKKPARIKEHIEMLAGEPNQQAFALDQLKASGEYAVPWMLRVLMDDAQARLHPFVIKAMPQLGRSAINPLLAALDVPNEPLQHFVMQMLGRIGYPQALPYLQRIATDDKRSVGLRDSARQAIEAVVVANLDVKKLPAAALFAQLAEQYYQETDSLMTDPREDLANVWFPRKTDLPREEPIEPVAVPRAIYPLVKTMQTAEASLALDRDQPAVLALWLAANLRREARLGLDVQSEETIKSADPTRPANWPRAIYFARSFGPRISRIALRRAIRDQDRDVALGCIEALNSTAGAAAMVEPDEAGGAMSLAEALHFPDLLVRISAALALARAMPEHSFKGAEEVVPVLASALSLTGRQFYLVVEPNEQFRVRISELLSGAQSTVVASDRLPAALNEARARLTHLDGIFLASDLDQPKLIESLRQLRSDDRFGLVPVVVIVKPGDNLVLDAIKAEDPRIGSVLDGAAEKSMGPQFAERLLAKLKQTAPKYGHHPMTPELGLALALAAAHTLEDNAITCAGVFDVLGAQSALIDALGHPSEELRVAAAWTLSRLNADKSQQAVASVALASNQTESLRLASFAALADSARRFGVRLGDRQLAELTRQAMSEPNLLLRTAASKTLGAMNLPAGRAAEILLAQPAR